ELGVILVVPAEIPGVTEEEIAGITIREPVLPDGPLPHLKEMLAGGEAPDIVPEPASPSEAFHELGANVPPQGGSGPVPLTVDGIPQPAETAFGSPLQQSADERRLQA